MRYLTLAILHLANSISHPLFSSFENLGFSVDEFECPQKTRWCVRARARTLNVSMCVCMCEGHRSMSDEFVNHLPLWFLKPGVLVCVELAEWLFRGRWNPKLRSSCFHSTSPNDPAL